MMSQMVPSAARPRWSVGSSSISFLRCDANLYATAAPQTWWSWRIRLLGSSVGAWWWSVMITSTPWLCAKATSLVALMPQSTVMISFGWCVEMTVSRAVWERP